MSHFPAHLAAQPPGGISAQVRCLWLEGEIREGLAPSPCCPLPHASHLTSLIPPHPSCHLGGGKRRRRRRPWRRHSDSCASARSTGGIPPPALPSCLLAPTHEIAQISFCMCPCMQTCSLRNISNLHTHLTCRCAHDTIICS